MAKQVINVGSSPRDRTGDKLRNAFIKVNANFTEVYDALANTDVTVSRVKSTASDNRRIEEVYGDSTVTLEPVITTDITTVASRSASQSSEIYIDITQSIIGDILNDTGAYQITDFSSIQFSLDGYTWFGWGGGTSFPEVNERGYSLNGSPSLTYSQGDIVYFRYSTGGQPVVWWNAADLPGGSTHFRGAIIDYHAFSGEATHIGTIHIVDDSGDRTATHTTVSSGNSDSENDDFCFVENEGTISYRRMDGEGKTLKVHWAARVFYGSQYYDD